MYESGLNAPYIRPKRHVRFVGMVPVVTYAYPCLVAKVTAATCVSFKVYT